MSTILQIMAPEHTEYVQRILEKFPEFPHFLKARQYFASSFKMWQLSAMYLQWRKEGREGRENLALWFSSWFYHKHLKLIIHIYE